jgi:dipeptidyl aminopeptidase/acylaminoacyl peptidase
VVPTGHLLYYWNGSLWGVPFHSETHKLTGSPVEVQTGVLGNGWLGGAARVSDNGTLVYLKQEGLPARRLVWVTPGRPDAELLLPPAAYEEAEVSPDGSRVAVVAQEELHRWNIGIYDIKSRGWTRLLDVDTERPRVAWSPDSQALAVGMSVEGGEFPNLFRVPVATPEKVERLGNQPDFGQFPMAWSGPANAILFLEGIHPGAESDVMILPLTGDRHPRLLVATPGPDRGPSFSPDGHWFTYSSDSAGQVFVQDVAQTLPARQISRERGSRNPLWAPSGKQIYFLAPSAALMEVSVDSQAIAGEPRQVIAGNFATLPDMWTRGYSLAPDGRFLVTRDIAPEHPAPSQINVVVNWFVELKRLAPVI